MSVTEPTIVFLARYPVSSRHRTAWGFDRLADAGFDVVVFDLHPLLAPWVAEADPNEDLGPARSVPVRTFGELDALVAEYASHAVFMDYIVGLADADWTGARVLRVLAKHQAMFYEMAAGDLPHPSQADDPQGRRELRATRLRKLLDVRQLAAYLQRKSLLLAQRAFGYVPFPDRIFGTRSETVLRYFDRVHAPKEIFVPANAPDYDRFREIPEAAGEAVAGTECVFVDMAMTSHPDITTLRLPTVDARRYYDAMTALFDGVERDTGMTVVVAAHPQADYAPGTFGERRIIKGETAALVKRSGCVITHASTAVGYAVLWRKPILFVVTDDMIKAGYHLDVLAMAKALCLTPHNADHWTPNRAEDDYLAHDDACYRAYEEEFLVSPESKDRSSWDVIAEYATADLVARSARMAQTG